MVKKGLLVLLALCLCLSLMGCGTQYEDTNGADDFTLQTITDENIVQLDTGSSGLGYSEENFADVLYSSEYHSNNFNGVEQIYLNNYILPSDVEIYIGHMVVESGNFKLAVVNNDEIIHEIALDSFGETIRFEDLSGSFSIHVAGESAKFEFFIEIY